MSINTTSISFWCHLAYRISFPRCLVVKMKTKYRFLLGNKPFWLCVYRIKFECWVKYFPSIWKNRTHQTIYRNNLPLWTWYKHLSPFMNLIHNIYLPLWIWYTTLIPLYEPDTQHLSPFIYLVHKLTLILQYLAVLS